MSQSILSNIENKAKSLGWDDVGITQATISQENIDAYNQWIKNQYHADLKYMENSIRCYPQKILPQAKSVIIFITFYKQPSKSFCKNKGLIASYARGRDYHLVHKKRLKKFLHWFQSLFPNNQSIGFCDSFPILEKALAVQAGLGWFGKNTLFIHKKFGTYSFISGILTTATLPYSQTKLSSHFPRCGQCNRCIDACPTKALRAPYHLDCTKCLSYHLIESKKNIPSHIIKNNPGYLFGCDICQEVCPHNQRKPLSSHPEFSAIQGFGDYLDYHQIINLSKNSSSFFGTALKRCNITRLIQIAKLHKFY